ncbi:MAG: hypothetical protein HZA19_02890 [Nitrospirae bacterium]|nr:hypothetical protein [Nitrospirota bacterium]
MLTRRIRKITLCYMKIVMDSDCLIKLTKAGAKEAVVLTIKVDIPELVKKETVDEARERDYHDATIIEENIDKKALHVVKPRRKGVLQVPAAKGEMEAVALYSEGGYDAIASDDRRFLKKLEVARIPYLTPTACIIYLYKSGTTGKTEVSGLLERLRPFISREEYRIAAFYLEGKR